MANPLALALAEAAGRLRRTRQKLRLTDADVARLAGAVKTRRQTAAGS